MPREMQPCGTYAAYQRHLKAGEKPCGPCRESSVEYQRARRAYRLPRRSEPRLPRPRGVARRVESPEDAHRAPCFANPGLWDPQGEWEPAQVVRARWVKAAQLCVTECPVFTHCRDSSVAGAAGVVAGRVPGCAS